MNFIQKTICKLTGAVKRDEFEEHKQQNERDRMADKERLAAAVAKLDDRDDQIVAFVEDLKKQVADLKEQIANGNTEGLGALADKIEESLTKFAAVAPAPEAPQ